MEKYLLGIDIGTSACKVAVFHTDGKVAAAGTAGYPVYYPREGWAEQDPRQWWEAVCRAIRSTLEAGGILPDQIAGIGVDGQSWSAIPVNKAGEVLYNTPIWMDTRAKDICRRVNEEVGEEEIFRLSGNPLQPSYTTGKILWYREHLPEVYKETDKILQSNAYIVFKLTGELTTDMSQAYGLHCFNMEQGVWDDDMCQRLGIPRELLPRLAQCSEVAGIVTHQAAQETGLAPGIPVVAGGLDAACGTLGAGVVSAGETQEQGGQAGGMSICIEEYKADPRLILSRHVVPDKWLLQGGTTGGGGVMRWFEQEFADYEREMEKTLGISSLVQLNKLGQEVSPGSDGMIFLPYMSGERSPIWNPRAKGLYYGLDFAKTKGHFVRASMEGVAYSLKHNLEIAETRGADVKELRAMGGAANSLLWTQIKADVTGKTIKVPASDTATTLGAVILAGIGVGMYRDAQEAVEKTVEIKRVHHPDMKNHAMYQKCYETYLELYENLKGTMEKQGGAAQ